MWRFVAIVWCFVSGQKSSTTPPDRAKIHEEYFFPKNIFPWQQFESGKISVDEVGEPREHFDYNKKPYLITFNGLDDIDEVSLEKIRNKLPGIVATKNAEVLNDDDINTLYDDEEYMYAEVLVIEFPGIEVEEKTKMVMYWEEIPDTRDDPLTPTIITTPPPNDYQLQRDAIDEPDLTSNDKFSQKNIVFEIKNDAGQIYVITLVEQEADTREFSLINTWIRPDPSNDVAVYLTSSFNFSGFDAAKKVVGFFDFRSLLWKPEELAFTHQSCFEPIRCHQPNDVIDIVECDYYYYQKRENCSDIFETSIKLGNQWHDTDLPINRFKPVVYDSSNGREKFVHLSPCPNTVTVVVKDLDGMGAAVKVPTVYLVAEPMVGSGQKLALTAPAEFRNAYEHGLILYKLNTTLTELPDAYFTDGTYIEIIDHPISAIDPKMSKTVVKWKHSECNKETGPASGRSVFHKVIPYCKEHLITETIEASLRQLEHIIDIDVLEIELSKSTLIEKGLNVVVTSTSGSITAQQKREIEEAVNIGRILALCLEQGETVEGILQDNPLISYPPRGPPTVRSSTPSPAAQTADAEPETAVNPTNAILLVPVLVGVLTGFTYFWCWWRNIEFEFNRLVVYRFVGHWIGVGEILLSTMVWMEYGTTKEIVDEASIVSVSLLVLILIGSIGAILRLVNFYQHLLDPKFNRLECMHYILDCICRMVPFAVIVGLMIVKYRPPSFGPSILHILCFVFQILLILSHLVTLMPEVVIQSMNKDAELRTRLQSLAFGCFNLMIFVVEIVLIINAANPTLDLEAQNRCIMIEKVDSDSLLSFAAPWKCFTISDKIMISLASLSAAIGMFLVIWNLSASYFKRGCRARLRSLSQSYGSIDRKDKSHRSLKARNEHFGSVSSPDSRTDSSLPTNAS